MGVAATAVGKCVTEIFSCAGIFCDSNSGDGISCDGTCGAIGSMTSLGKEGSVIAKLESPRTLAAIPFSDLDTVVGPVAAPSARRVPAVEKSVEILGVSDGRAWHAQGLVIGKDFLIRLLRVGVVEQLLQ